MEKPRILVVEDDRSLREALRYNLASEGYEVQIAKNGQSGLRAVRTFRPDVIILDVMLPLLTGIEVSKALQAEGSLVPIIMLTAKTSVEDRVAGLGSGAVDYITKPFSTDELLARVGAQMRRTMLNQTILRPRSNDVIEFDDIAIDLASRTVKARDAVIELNLREFDLLVFLVGNPGRVYSREALLNRVWEPEFSGNPRTVDVHMRWLRTKIEFDPSNPKYLQTVRGVGYRFDLS